MVKSLREAAFDDVAAGNIDVAVWTTPEGEVIDWQTADRGAELEGQIHAADLTTVARRGHIVFAGMYNAETIQQIRGEQI